MSFWIALALGAPEDGWSTRYAEGGVVVGVQEVVGRVGAAEVDGGDDHGAEHALAEVGVPSAVEVGPAHQVGVLVGAVAVIGGRVGRGDQRGLHQQIDLVLLIGGQLIPQPGRVAHEGAGAGEDQLVLGAVAAGGDEAPVAQEVVAELAQHAVVGRRVARPGGQSQRELAAATGGVVGVGRLVVAVIVPPRDGVGGIDNALRRAGQPRHAGGAGGRRGGRQKDHQAERWGE